MASCERRQIAYLKFQIQRLSLKDLNLEFGTLLDQTCPVIGPGRLRSPRSYALRGHPMLPPLPWCELNERPWMGIQPNLTSVPLTASMK